jgi:hypothetical protein
VIEREKKEKEEKKRISSLCMFSCSCLAALPKLGGREGVLICVLSAFFVHENLEIPPTIIITVSVSPFTMFIFILHTTTKYYGLSRRCSCTNTCCNTEMPKIRRSTFNKQFATYTFSNEPNKTSSSFLSKETKTKTDCGVIFIWN